MTHVLRRLTPLIYLLLFTFSWNSLGLTNYAYAFEEGPARPQALLESPWLKLNRVQEQLVTTVKDIEGRLNAGQDVAAPLGEIQALALTIQEINAEIHQANQAMEQSLLEKNLGGEILQRHRDAVTRYESDMQQLLSRLQAIEQARDYPSLMAQVKALSQLLQPPHQPATQPIDPDKLPHRTPTVQPRPPATSKLELPEFYNRLPKEGVAIASLSPVSLNLVGQASDTPQPQDLQETLEVKFTPEIQQLANSLGKNPVRLFEYVRNQFEYEPTYGSIKGAQGTLWAKSGNDFDQASLLIALLRASGIPARYEYGTIEVPIDKAMSWVGMENPLAASSLFSSGGIPAAAIIDGNTNQVVKLRKEHVWVKAWTDYTPSRGGVFQEGDRWVRLDPSFKQHDLIAGVDLNNVMPFDAQEFFDQLTAAATQGDYWVTNVNPLTIQAKVNELKTQLDAYLDAHPTHTMREVIGLKRPIIKEYGILPVTANYAITAQLNEYSEIPDHLRHKLTFGLANIDSLTGFTDPVFSYTARMPELASRRITLSYAPADPATENYLNSLLPAAVPGETLEQQIARLPTSINARVVRLRPELKIDGVTVATGSSIGMGYEQQFDLNFSSPGNYNNDNVSNTIVAGSYNAVVLNLGPVSREYVNQRRQAVEQMRSRLESGDPSGYTKDDVIGETLHLAGIKYWTEINLYSQVAQQMTGTVATRLPSEGIFSYNLNVIWSGFILFTPQTAYDGGLGTDIDHELQAVVSRDNDSAKAKNYMLATGGFGSFMEASVYDEMLHFTDQIPGLGISTSHILAYANAQGIPVYHINKSNIAVLSSLQLSDYVKDDILAKVNADKIVTVPARNLTINGWWTGVGYVVSDPDTGAGAYLISGGYAGGGFQLPTLHPLLLFLIGAVLTGIGIFAGLGLGIALAIAAILIGLYDLISSSLPILDDPNLTPDEKDMIVGFLTALFIIGAILAVVGIFFGGVLGFVAVAMLFLFISIIASNIITNLAPALARRRNQTGGSLWRWLEKWRWFAHGDSGAGIPSYGGLPAPA